MTKSALVAALGACSIALAGCGGSNETVEQSGDTEATGSPTESDAVATGAPAADANAAANAATVTTDANRQ